jgi:hypothetical protein
MQALKNGLRLLVLTLLVAHAHSQSNVRDTGPINLLLLYKCAPSNRIPLREYMSHRGIAQFRAWKAKGILSGEQILFSRYVDTESWDMLIFLQFRAPEDVAKWNGIERSHPAGLDAEGLRLITGVSTYQLDLVQTGALATAATRPVYVVIPYDYTVSTDEYLQYLRDYVVPQTSGWMDAGVLQSYRLFIGRGVAGRPWSSVFLLEYKDDDALGQREATIARIRDTLKKNPGWKAISDSKQSVRVEKAPIVADELK